MQVNPIVNLFCADFFHSKYQLWAKNYVCSTQVQWPSKSKYNLLFFTVFHGVEGVGPQDTSRSLELIGLIPNETLLMNFIDLNMF